MVGNFEEFSDLHSILDFVRFAIARLDDTFSEILELEANAVQGQPLQRKIQYKKRRKRKGEKYENELKA